jgi:hypothetical protein
LKWILIICSSINDKAKCICSKKFGVLQRKILLTETSSDLASASHFVRYLLFIFQSFIIICILTLRITNGWMRLHDSPLLQQHRTIT